MISTDDIAQNCPKALDDGHVDNLNEGKFLYC